MKRKLLTLDEIKLAASSIPGWENTGKSFSRDFTFSNFSETFAFMTEVALVSEKLNHHPEWTNVYNKISIIISTHDSGGITELDLEWISAVNKIVERR